MCRFAAPDRPASQCAFALYRDRGTRLAGDYDGGHVLREALAETPPHLADVARAVCLCDVGPQFELGLDALLPRFESVTS
jgi:hypothetical protein